MSDAVGYLSKEIKKALVYYTSVLGLKVIPLHEITRDGSCSCNRNCGPKNAGKHPRIANWHNEATNDLNKVLRWWKRWPNANIAIPAGPINGFFAIDIDDWDAWQELNRELEPTTQYATPRGGRHFWFQYPDNQEITNSRGALPIGIDVRGSGGYVIVPPSRTLKGLYQFFEHHEVPPAPNWLLESLAVPEPNSDGLVDEKDLKSYGDLDTDTQNRYKRYVQSAVDCEIEALHDLTAEPGLQWNNTTYNSACNLFELAKAPWSPLTCDEAEEIIRAHIPPFDNEGWTPVIIDKLIDSAYKKVMHNGKARPYPPGETKKPATKEQIPNTISEFQVIWYSDIPDEDFEWYEKDWIPQKGAVLLAGYGGSGKSTLFAYWIKCITTGLWTGKPQNVVYLTREDSRSAIIRPKLITAGADISRVATILMREPDINGTMKERAVNFKRHLEDIRRLIRETRAMAVFLDPAVSFLGIDEDKDSKDMQRTVLEDLVHFCDEEQLLSFAIKHNKKVQSGSERLSGRDKIYGSTVWYEVFRHVLSLRKVDDDLRLKLGLDEDDSTAALLTIEKNSYGRDDLLPKAFKIEERQYRKNMFARLMPDGERNISTKDIDAREVETEEQTERRETKYNIADKWIIETLNALGGVCLRTKILELREAQKAAPSLSTFKRRIEALADVEKRKSERNSIVIYTLKDQYRQYHDPRKDLDM